jgi:hypothetical protein
MTSIDIYNDAIVSVKDKIKSVDLSDKPRKLLFMTHVYSNTKMPTARFEIDGVLITRNNNLVVQYKCLTCSVINQITLNLYLRKVNKGKTRCDACKNQEEEKCKAHSLLMTDNKLVSEGTLSIIKKRVKWSDKTLSERIEESLAAFEKEDDDFKCKYFLIHYTSEEFALQKSKIISIGNDKICDLSEWSYIPCYKIGNQTKYTPMLFNLGSNSLEKPSYVKWKCETCDSLFINRDLEIQKNRIKILCGDCGFSNRIFKIKSMKTPWGKIQYQSQYEKRFIDWCVEKNIEISNGPEIGYTWKEKSHKYKVDFQIPSQKFLVELKDNHVWHKLQIDNGKWGAKETIAKLWCEENDWQFKLVFPKTMSTFKNKLLETCKI